MRSSCHLVWPMRWVHKGCGHDFHSSWSWHPMWHLLFRITLIFLEIFRFVLEHGVTHPWQWGIHIYYKFRFCLQEQEYMQYLLQVTVPWTITCNLSTRPSYVAHCNIPISSWYISKLSGSSSCEPSNSGKYNVTIGVDTLFCNFHCLVFSPSSTKTMPACLYLTLPHRRRLWPSPVDWLVGTYQEMQSYYYCIVLYCLLGSSVFLSSTDISSILSTYISMYS